MDQYQQFIHKSRYARWLPEQKRRETWAETVNRYVAFWVDRGQLDQKTSSKMFDAIHNMDVMPSMRCMMTAGEALDKDNVAGFNCSYLLTS
jgi:ribonucleoside-diphosphate reductase alpha chain